MESKPQVETYGNSKSHFPGLRISVIQAALRRRGWLGDAQSGPASRAAPAGSGSASDVSATWHFSTLQVPSANRNLKLSIWAGLWGPWERRGGPSCALHLLYIQEQRCHQAWRARSHKGQPANREAACNQRITPGASLRVYAGRNVCKTGRSVVFDAVCTQWNTDRSFAPEGCAESSNGS